MAKVGMKTYFYGLDAFRGIAALLVIMGHVELVKSSQGLPNLYASLPFYMAQGDLAVTFFFVLSGFLITYLLLVEKEKYGFVSIFKFYLRRVTKIWPLYLLLTFIGFYYLYLIAGTGGDFMTSLYFHLAVLPNIAPKYNPLAYQSWSIGVEEQFYLFWPLLFFLSKRKLFVSMVLIIIAVYILRALPVVLLKKGFINSESIMFGLKNFFATARFDNMALGGVLAYLMYYNIFYVPRVFKYPIYCATLMLMVLQVTFKYGTGHLIYGTLYALIIYFIVSGTSSDSFLEHGVLKYLGKISYGIYMWHVIAIELAILLTRSFLNFAINADNFVLHSFSIAITILLSALSFHLFESYFLKIKDRIIH